MVHIIARLSENFTYDMMQSVRAEQQVQSKMTEMINSAISETAENAKIMVETATDSAKMMENSMESIQSIRESATQIGKTNSHVAETMEELQKKSKEVQQITEVIFTISNQTVYRKDCRNCTGIRSACAGCDRYCGNFH